MDCADYRQIFLTDTPLLDVRAPVEFNKGAFPQAHNLPLMTDNEREQVGRCYKQHGQEAAVELGHQLVKDEVKAARVAAWKSFASAHPQGMMYCFRGGMRSGISQQWLQQAGVDYPRVAGGYKAMRNFLINEVESAAQECQFTLLSGLTGTGKTDLLVKLKCAVDLEGLANHRGSSFGKHVSPQPTQIDFENKLGIDFLKRRHQGVKHFILENESRLIGSCALPLSVQQAMQQAPIILLVDDLDTRVQRIVKDYIVNLSQEFVQQYGPELGFEKFSERLQQSLNNLKKRLGGLRYNTLSEYLNLALKYQAQNADLDAHRVWIKILLEEYYDPMYQYHQQRQPRKIVFQGDFQAVSDYLSTL